MKHCFLYSLCFGIISSLILILLRDYITTFCLHSKVPSYIFIIIAISLPFISISSCLNGYFTALRKNIKNAISKIFEQFVKISITAYILSVFLPNGVEYAILSLVLGETISEIASFLFSYFLYKLEDSKHTLPDNKQENYLKHITCISIPIAITSYIRSGLSSIKQLLIPIRLEKSGLSCNEAISHYALINSMTMPILMFPEVIIFSFSGLLVPEFAYYNEKNETIKIQYAISRIFRITFIFAIGIFGLFFFYSNEVSMLIYSNTSISTYLKTLSFLLFFMYLDSIIDNILKGLDEQVGVMKCNILDLFVSIIAIYFLVPIYGVNGYIFTIFLSELLNFSISLCQLKRKTSFTVDYLNWLIKPILGIIFAYFVCFFIEKSIITSTNVIFTMFIFLFSYFVFLLFSYSFES